MTDPLTWSGRLSSLLLWMILYPSVMPPGTLRAPGNLSSVTTMTSGFVEKPDLC